MRRVVLLLVCLTLLACQGEQEELRIGGNRWLGYAPFYLTDELQQLQASGLRLVEYPNATGVLRGFRNGLLDAALLTLDEALALQSSGLDLELLLVTDISAGADALFARPPIMRISELKGQRIGVENTALGAFMLARVLDKAGLQRSDVKVIDLPVHEQVGALRHARIDAVISFASEGPALEALGARRIFDSREIPEEIIDVLVVERSRVDEESRERIKQLWYESLDNWQQNRARSDPHLHTRLNLDPQSLKVTLDGLVMGDRALNQQMLNEGLLLQRMQRVHQYMLDYQLLKQPGQPEAMLPAACGRREC
ncbi:ABC transporter substrate-binding protein [Pseudomonas sp.]|uniref:ABC transporter substrate-binding protein n=1 Tax=Pseudomonas sp. TaxID=306 RepID=UPI002731D69E|nr:ABC transporter substrate-binding protein [Pseudomonas sp.]MDP2242675.1 ABC transporter substrate-binding protein [Pseudomonas sp.]